MVIRLLDPSWRDELRAHFVRAGFEVVEAGEHDLSVSRGDAPDTAQARREVEAQLAVWPLLYPGVAVELLGDAAPQ